MVVSEAHAGGSQRVQPRGERAVGLAVAGGLLVEAVVSGAGHRAHRKAVGAEVTPAPIVHEENEHIGRPLRGGGGGSERERKPHSVVQQQRQQTHAWRPARRREVRVSACV